MLAIYAKVMQYLKISPKIKFKRLIFQHVRAQKKIRGENQEGRETIKAVEKFRPEFLL